MLSPWLNTQVKVQRRSGTARNALNEPDWGDESNYSVAYPNLDVRIEIIDEGMEFNETGERVTEQKTLMFYESGINIQPLDRITIVTTDDNTNFMGKYFIVQNTHAQWDSIGNTHHYVAELNVH
jgi:hypothetical protein